MSGTRGGGSTKEVRPALRGADLRGADLDGADLSPARLSGADLSGANLTDATLAEADLSAADLSEALLIYTVLRGADLTDAVAGYTIFANVSLKNVTGLASVSHTGPSTVGIDTLHGSQGRLPDEFLKGCGLADWEIKAARLYDPELSASQRNEIHIEVFRLQSGSPIQINPLFLSYSHADAAFLNALEPKFDEQHIRHWRDVHDMTAGRVEKQIDSAMRLNPTVILVLSERSVESDWVEWEASQARELEKELDRDVLCPVALDDLKT